MNAEVEAPKREFLTCRLGDETYAVDILQVQEIREVNEVTRVPHVAPFVRGVINLRGAIVPIVDLGLMFGFAEPAKLAGASAIVLDVDRRLVGLVVSSVSDVLALAEDEIAPTPELGTRAIAAAIAGIGTRRVMLHRIGMGQRNLERRILRRHVLLAQG
jgi:purine-binding chemotaxis protein CheW